MAEISVGSAVGSGFQLIRERPLSVLTWGLLRVGFLVAVFGVYAPTVLSMMSDAMQDAHTSPGGQLPQAEVGKMMSHLFLLQGVGLLAQLVGLLVSSMIVCAVARSIVHPERRAFASLRLGSPELFVIILSFGLSFVLAFCLLIVLIPFGIAIGFLAADRQYVAAAIVGGLALFVLLVGGIYVAARFAFVVPMMVEDGQFHLFDAWTLTKGRVGGIILTGLCLMLIAIVFGLLLDLVFAGLVFGVVAVVAGGPDHLQAFFTQTQPQTLLVTFAPWLLVIAALAVPIEGCALAIFLAPWSRAYRDVVPSPSAPPEPQPPLGEPLAAAP